MTDRHASVLTTNRSGTAIEGLLDMQLSDRGDRLAGVLLGVALGDALGLPFEGLSFRRLGRRARALNRFRLAGRTGFVSDDTEQTALVAQALTRGGDNPEQCLRWFRRSMVGWFLRLPFGIGFGTLRACLGMVLGVRRPGVRSAGNGAAMRAGIVGAHFADDAGARRAVGRALASLTHTDERAIEGALYVAELAARAVSSEPDANPIRLVDEARAVLRTSELVAAVDTARALARDGVTLHEAVTALGNTGFVVHSLGLCTYCFARHGADPMAAIEGAILAGGDTDTHAAIVGGWIGGLHGAKNLPVSLLVEIHDGPFGPSHLRALAVALVEGTPPPAWSWPRALIRNLALYPVVLAHGFARLVPW